MVTNVLSLKEDGYRLRKKFEYAQTLLSVIGFSILIFSPAEWQALNSIAGAIVSFCLGIHYAKFGAIWEKS